ncbi:conserved hypothetical protein [Burkholderia sp. 8Y]|uniref:hypothetical protein n=1 Tax=Burkholderia sp. 8Y TaxID=2653133 RepID=UPI0012F1B980|nr:hypothetical protein [Burkholderia sp. 8Y]VXC67990.1 conserved hypothetical protein [Burkholderia sp. 8Y]
MSRVVILSLASLTDDDEGDVALPAEIKSESGSLVERVILSTKRPTTVQLPDDSTMRRASSDRSGRAANSGLSFVVVELATRHGTGITRRIPLIGRFAQHTIDLVPDDIPEWLMWASADVDLARTSRVPFADTAAYHVWGRLWARRLRAWRPVDLLVGKENWNAYAKQFELTTHEPSLLQIGGPELSSRFVSLPQGRIKVLLTANAAGTVNRDPLNIVVSRVSAGPRNTLLSLLSLNPSQHANNVAKELSQGFDWQGVGEDALSGCALGFAAMRMRALDRFTVSDATSLFQTARGSSDAAIVLANRELAEKEVDLSRVLRLLDVGIGRAIPVLVQSLAAAMSTLETLRRRPDVTEQRMLASLMEKARTYSRARTGAGPFLSFQGWAPHAPGEPQASHGWEHAAIRGVGSAFAAIASGFKPMAATALIHTERTVSQPQHVNLDTAQ